MAASGRSPAATLPKFLSEFESLAGAEKLALAVQIAASYTHPQQVDVLLNGKSIGVIAAPTDGEEAEHTLPFDSSLLVPSVGRHFNLLEFRVIDFVSPAAAEPGAPDHHSGLVLHDVRLIAIN